MMEKAKKAFEHTFGRGGEIRTFFAPGRVNLIGEHTDYNGGHVFPCALSVGTYAVARKREDNVFRLYSLNFEGTGIIEVDTASITYRAEDDWANYPKGVMKVFQQHGYAIPSGADILFAGDIPNGAGLSSSASIELVTSVLLNELFNLQVERIEMIKMSRQCENEFIGVSCGIMDQFASGMGKKDQAMLLNCQTLEYTYSPLPLGNAVLVIANTNKRRGLADSKYNERLAECEQAVRQLQKAVNIETLGELSNRTFDEYAHVITDDTVQRRARHAVYENNRTQEAVQKLLQGDISGFGQLMNDSHRSLRDDYEVTGFELDTLVEAAWETEGVIGSRMTGAGFGGCTVSIVEQDRLDHFREHVGRTYKEKTGLEADFYIVDIGDGAREITA
jgi:galactokinase